MNEHALKVIEYSGITTLLAGYASSSLGRSVCDEIRPICEYAKVVAAIEQTSEMKQLLASQDRFPISGLRDLRPHLKKMRDAGHLIDPADIREFYDTLSSSTILKHFLQALSNKYPRLSDIADNLMEFPDLCNAIDFAIDRKGAVRDSASKKLAETRRKIAVMQTSIRHKVETIMQSKNIRQHLQQDGYSIRNGRCVLLVRIEHKYKIRGIIHDISQTGSTAFIEPEVLVEMGNDLSDLIFEGDSEVARILWDLTFKILNRESDIRINIELLAWVDFTYAKALFSEQYRMNAPQINEHGHLKLRKARHPLLISHVHKACGDLDEAFRKVEPLSIHVGDTFDLLIVTGPNTGGKTVALKAVGLITAMALTGMHIPAAAGSEVAVFHDIFADIGDEQSIEQSLSTFSAHMSNIVRILAETNEHSLVLLDELGSGTDPDEGAALSISILDSFYRRKVKTIVTTHLGRLKSYAYSHARAENASMEFDLKTLGPTYKMTIGLPGTSHAITIAGRLGMTQDIVDEARSLISKTDTSTTEIINEIQNARMELECNREKVDQLREELETMHDDASKKTADLIARHEMLTTEAQHEIDAAIRNVRQKIAPSLKMLNNAPQQFRQKALEIERLVEETLNTLPLAQKRLNYIHGLKKGEYINVPRLKRRCRIKRVNKKLHCVVVLLGDLEIEVDFEDITWTGQE